MDLKTRELRQAKKLTPELKKKLAAKHKNFPNQLEVGRWYSLLVEISGDTLNVSIDDREIGSFQSEGIAHPTKRTLRLAVPKSAIVDDLKIWKR